MGEGIWEGTYAATNPREYFAEGVQSWFGTNRENDSEHNEVDTREELVSYDTRLADCWQGCLLTISGNIKDHLLARVISSTCKDLIGQALINLAGRSG